MDQHPGTAQLNTEASVIYENTVPAAFVRRLNRFTAEVRLGEESDIVIVHVKNTGRLGELLLPGAKVMLQRAGTGSALAGAKTGNIADTRADTTAGTAAGRVTGASQRKTAYDLISVYKPGLEWVNIDSLVPNQLMKQYLLSQDYDLVRPEFTYGDSRFDFYMERGGEKYLTEVKGCTLAAEIRQGIQSESGVTGDHCLIGLFPDAPTERGVKHLNELTAAASQGWHCAVAFVIQMNGIHTVRSNDATQPAFGEALKRAVAAGVQVQYFGCRVEADRIALAVEEH